MNELQNCQLLDPDIFKDHRGTIRSYFPTESLVEYNLMITKKGDARGYHYHPHFVEYMVVVEGECLFKEYDNEKVNEIILKIGDSIRIPKNIPHTFIALTDMKFVSLLTKNWKESHPPIVKVDENGKPV